jgi:hypothetical protein
VSAIVQGCFCYVRNIKMNAKLGGLVVCSLVMLAGCGGTSDDAVSPDEATAPVEAAAAAEMLGGGVLTPVHDGDAGSPHVQVSWEVDGATISISYGRPFLKGRIVGESVEPLDGAVWRLGADEATTLTTDRDLMIGAAHVPAGEYTLWTLSDGATTELIVNSETGQWGTSYDAARDLGRTTMTVGTLDTPADQLTFHVDDSEIRAEWGTMVASVPIMVH